MTRSVIVIASLFTFVDSALAASIPGILPVQGRLVDSNAVPVTDANLTFRLLDDQGDELYADTPAVEFDDNGFFTAYLGELGDLDLTLFRDNAAVALEVDIEGDDTAIGPFELGQVPYAGFAYLAGDAETLGGLGPDDFLSVDYVPSWEDLTGVPDWAMEGYSAGWGLELSGTSGTEFSVDQTDLDTIFATDAAVSTTELDKTFATDAAVSTALTGKKSASYVPDWTEITNVPSDLSDGDQDTLYWADEAQAAVLLDPSTNDFSLDQDVIEDWAAGVCYDTETELTALLDDNYVSKDGSGNVGIGTDTPDARLHVADGALVLGPVGGASEGGQAQWYGEGSYPYFYVDNYKGDMRVVTEDTSGESVKLLLTNGGALTVNGQITANGTLGSSGQLSSQGGAVRRDFLVWNTATLSDATPIHIKTNIQVKSWIMFRFLVEGYNYGISEPINSETVGYTYGEWECSGNVRNIDHAAGVKISQYCSSDGYVVLKLDPPTGTSFYYPGFSVSGWFTNPAGQGWNVSATVTRQTENL